MIDVASAMWVKRNSYLLFLLRFFFTDMSSFLQILLYSTFSRLQQKVENILQKVYCVTLIVVYYI
nr:MAG TPA: hypothetical protein [Caudoviricetes sp.]